MDFPPLLCSPKPVQKPHPPILIGGELEKAAQRILAFGDGWIPRVRTTSKYSDPEMLVGGRRHIEKLYREQGKDFSSFTITAWDAKPDREQNRRYFDAGAERVRTQFTMAPGIDRLAEKFGLGARAAAE